MQERFVLAAADDWYQRRRDDEVGRFFRAIADQGPRKGRNGTTRQGRYVFTASGKLLAYNNNRNPERILAMLKESLEAFRKLQATERRAGAVKVPCVPPGGQDSRYLRRLQGDVLPIKIHTRTLRKKGEGFEICGEPGANSETLKHNGFGVAVDHLWIRKVEVDEIFRLSRAEKEPSIPRELAMRIARFHLVDNTRGEPPHWRPDEVRVLDLRLSTIPTGTPNEDMVRIKGPFHIETKDKQRGYTGEVDGTLRILKATNEAILKMVAIGDHWGHGSFTRGARPGKKPLAVVFREADRSRVEDRLPPQGIRWADGYWNAGGQ